MPKEIKTRFAPSPTGFLHVGSLRTALYAYLFAQKNKGKFLLRIEDTDQSRKVEGAIENLQKTLKDFNLEWDNSEPMLQSSRLDIYKKFAEQLAEEGKAYYCFCTSERLEQLKKVQQQKKLPPMYDGKCRKIHADEIKKNLADNMPHVIRFKMPKTGLTEFIDLVRSKVSFDNKILDDQIILKSDGFPTYHLASVVDDHEMDITHVIRGEEWLPSTPKHILMYRAFNWPMPEFAHLPLILNPDRTKLSKRQGDVAVEDYIKKGYLPESLLNFVLLLGWNPGTDQEIFNLKEMIKNFSLEKVNKAGAIFNHEKLDWMNGEYIKQKPLSEIAKLCQPFFKDAGIKADSKLLKKVAALEQPRIKRLDEIAESTEFFFKQPEYEANLLLWKKAGESDTANNLDLLAKQLESIDDKKYNQKDLEKEIIGWIKKNNYGVGDMLWPMRVALSGKKASPGPFEIAEILGKTETLIRIKIAINLFK